MVVYWDLAALVNGAADYLLLLSMPIDRKSVV